MIHKKFLAYLLWIADIVIALAMLLYLAIAIDIVLRHPGLLHHSPEPRPPAERTQPK
jgi:hypothetical protein